MSATSWGRPRPTSTPWQARGGHGGRHLANVKTRNKTPASRRYGVWGSGRLPQGGEAPLPLPWGLGRRCGRGRRCHHRTTITSAARRCLCGARRLSHGLPGGGRSRARPRSYLLCRLRGSGQGGAGSHLSGWARPPLLSSSSSSDDEYYEVVGEESPCCSRSRNSSLLCSRRSRRLILFFLRAARSCSRRCAALGLGAWAGQTARRSQSPTAGNERKVRPCRHAIRKWRERR
jgi:hypothetical protein